ncbi:hypothetical protein [Arthrobacter crystallopoietes]|uniref:hypothetical protein n=1 Tax=Crystallibacter crystallopoietes TaxID=37928 RepID=UPI000C774248|nr:hypothetical protein [Arthrobacter crystallopoietes]AUI52811.1 hypothetical protein AC20117_20450 [Arthrobacter crystallopoietes]
MFQVYEVTDLDMATYRVTSAAGTAYFLDLTPPSRTLTRLPFEHDQHPAFDLDPAKALRRDGEPLRLVFLDTLRVGESARFWLDVREDGILTWRETTPITSITELKNGS